MKKKLELDLETYTGVDALRRLMGVHLKEICKNVEISVPTLSGWSKKPKMAKIGKVLEIRDFLLNLYKKDRNRFDFLRIKE